MTWKTLLAGAAVAGFAAVVQAPNASATILFQDDFESYLSGSDLIGQNGWTLVQDGPMRIEPGIGLPTKVQNGRYSNSSLPDAATHSLSRSLDANGVSVLTFHGYGGSSNPGPSTNSAVGLQPGQGLFVTVPSLWWEINVNFKGWVFDARGVTTGYDNPTNRYAIPDTYDKIGRFSIVVDGILNEVYGIADFGAGPIETPHFSVLDSVLGGLDTVFIFQDDANGRFGAEFDNISVVAMTAVREPLSMALLGLGLAGLGWMTRRRA